MRDAGRLSDNICPEIHVGPVAGQSRDIVAPALMIVSMSVSALVGKPLAIRTACTANPRQSSATCDFMAEDQFRGVGHKTSTSVPGGGFVRASSRKQSAGDGVSRALVVDDFMVDVVVWTGTALGIFRDSVCVVRMCALRWIAEWSNTYTRVPWMSPKSTPNVRVVEG